MKNRKKSFFLSLQIQRSERKSTMEKITLTNENIHLRALEAGDIDFLYLLENEENLWKVSNTITPFSRTILAEYIAGSYRSIYEIQQLRLVICKKSDERPIGLIDLFDFDPKNKRVGIGIVIYYKEERQKGYAAEALKLVCDYAFSRLDVHQVYANIPETNTPSIRLFEKLSFEKTGVKKDWIYWNGTFENQYLYQLIRNSGTGD